MGGPVVTISAAFGTGGSRVAPDVADRLGVAFHDRAITREVARRLEVPLESALEQEQNPPGAVSRFLASMVALGGTVTGAGATVVPEHVADATAYRRHADAALRGFAAEGGVILGRAAAIALAGWPGALHVRLDGPAAARQAAARSRGEAATEGGVESELRRADRAREAYVRCFYNADARDPAHYHLVLDTTAVGLPAAVDVIVVAARARAALRAPA